MGNKLCCDAKSNENMTITTENAQSLISEFMKKNQPIAQICKTPGSIFGEIMKDVRQYQNGTYIGRITNKKRNGLGLMLFDDGMYYQGQWVDDKFKGRGIFVFTNGDFYDGEWLNCLPQGLGQYVNRQTNWKYIGSWEKGIQNGRGKQIFQDGSFYQGGFLNGLRDGKGKFRNHDGRYYQGQFSKGQVEGSAMVVDFHYIYEGEWKEGKQNGAGKSQWYGQDKQLQSVYIGEYKQGIKNGYGEYKEKDGNIYKGNWQNGQTTNGIVVPLKNSSINKA